MTQLNLVSVTVTEIASPGRGDAGQVEGSYVTE